MKIGCILWGDDSMLKMEQLLYLTRVAKYNSINKAAESLYITKAAVSSSIKQLEKECGYPMLERTYRGVRLTKNGERAVKMAEQVLSLCEEIEGLECEKAEKIEKKELIVPNQILKLLSSKLLGFNSNVLDYFILHEVENNIEKICELLKEDVLALVGVVEDDIKVIEKYTDICCHELWRSNLYPVSNKKTKWVDKDRKVITLEELETLPLVVMTGMNQKRENVVLQTTDPDIYAEAILNDLGIGVVAKYSPEIFSQDYKKFKLYEPLSAETAISILFHRKILLKCSL